MRIVRDRDRVIRGLGRWGARLAIVALLIAGLGAGRAAAAVEDDQGMSPAARAHYDMALSHYTARAFAEAARAFAAAHALDPRREILFAQAQATRLSGDCARAVGLYQAFLATSPPPQQIEATRLALARCRDPKTGPAPPPGNGEASGTAVPNAVAPRPPGVAPSALVLPAGSSPPVAAGPRPIWWRDPYGLSLAAAAVASWGVALGVGIAAARADGDAGGAPGYEGFEERRHVAESRVRWAQGAAAIGAAFTAGAAARFVWVGWPRPGPVIGVEGRF